MALKKYRYIGSLDEVELPEFGVTVARGHLVEVDGSIKHPDFDLHHDAPKKPKSKKAAAPAPEPAAEVAPEPAAPVEENV